MDCSVTPVAADGKLSSVSSDGEVAGKALSRKKKKT
jgi:hypothetical protein